MTEKEWKSKMRVSELEFELVSKLLEFENKNPDLHYEEIVVAFSRITARQAEGLLRVMNIKEDEKTTYKEGDVVVITANYSNHVFEIGSKVTINEIREHTYIVTDGTICFMVGDDEIRPT